LTAMINAVMMGNRNGRREASPMGIMCGGWVDADAFTASSYRFRPPCSTTLQHTAAVVLHARIVPEHPAAALPIEANVIRWYR